jgi:hypothetical protein
MITVVTVTRSRRKTPGRCPRMRLSFRPAAHSRRRLPHRDGLPCLDMLSPWKRDVESDSDWKHTCQR